MTTLSIPKPISSHRARTGRRSGWVRWGLPVATVLAACAILEILVRSGLIPSTLIPEPTATLGRLLYELTRPFLWTATGWTFAEAGLGLFFGALFGIPAGLVVGMNPTLYRAIRVPLEFLRPVPSAAYIPLLVLIMGTGLQSKVIVVSIAIFWLMLIQTMYGVQDTDPTALDGARAYGVGWWERLWRVIVPSTLPYLGTAFRLGTLMAIVVAITAELAIGSGGGLGNVISAAASEGLRALTFAYVVFSGLLGVGIAFVVDAVERRVLFWHASFRADGRSRRERETAFSLAREQAAWRARRVVRQLLLGGARRRLDAGPPMTRARRTVGMVLQVAVPVVILVVWWFWSAAAGSLYFPPLSRILGEFSALFLGPQVTQTLLPTLWRFIAGFLAGEGIGIALGLLIGLHPAVRTALMPLIQFFRCIPGPVLIPLFVVFLGVDDLQKIVTVAAVGIPIAMLNAIDGVKGLEPMSLEMARAYGVRGVGRFRYVTLPGALPRLVAGARIHMIIALVILIVAEMTGATSGLGYVLARAQSSYNLPQLWACIIMIGILGYVLNVCFALTEKRLISWHRAARRSSFTA